MKYLTLGIRLVSHTHTHTIDVIVDVRMTSRDVIVGIRMTSLPVYGHTECDTRLLLRGFGWFLLQKNLLLIGLNFKVTSKHQVFISNFGFRG